MVLKHFGMDNRTHEGFENDVKMYGTETWKCSFRSFHLFENDVKMYGTETDTVSVNGLMSLRMM